MSTVASEVGLNQIEWARARKSALLEQSLGSGLWERMSPQQKWFMQQLRLAFDDIEGIEEES